MRRPRRLFARLLLSQLIAIVGTHVLTAIFAPRVLLLLPAVASATSSLLFTLGVLSAAFAMASTAMLLGPVAPALRSLARGVDVIEAHDVLRLHELPIRLVVANVGFVVIASVATLIPSLRPSTIDPYTALVLGLLLVTMRSTAGLPAYVLMRASITRTLELTSVLSTSEALEGLQQRVHGRVRRRFVAAVTAPVLFVALGASLLVDAHARAYDRNSRANDAIDLAGAVFESLPSTDRQPEGPSPARSLDYESRLAARAVAATFGFEVREAPDYRGPLVIEHGTEGESHVIVPEVAGATVIGFGTSRLEPVVFAYALLAVVAALLVSILGTRIGVAFESDVALATHEIRRAGVADVLRGTMILHHARFAKNDALLQAIDALGAVFREFASAQERAIDARTANERMRGLLLASMSHDLKAPLNAVLGFAALVGRSELADGQKESLAIIEQRGRELLMLIDTILDSARVEVGELEVSPSSTLIADVVMAAVLETRALSVGMQVQIKGEIQPGIPPLFVDGMRIVQALTGVSMTAVRFSERGIVEVRATLPGAGDRLRIEVESSGEGLPATERDKIFEAFKSAAMARRHGALGLGLQLARSILEIHGGELGFEDTAAGGIVFRMWLPVSTDGTTIRERASRTALPD